MTHEAKKFTVTILGQTYTLMSDETEEHIERAAAVVDTAMREILQKIPHIDAQKVAVLVALKYASKFLAQESNMHSISKRETELIGLINREMQNAL